MPLAWAVFLLHITSTRHIYSATRTDAVSLTRLWAPQDSSSVTSASALVAIRSQFKKSMLDEWIGEYQKDSHKHLIDTLAHTLGKKIYVAKSPISESESLMHVSCRKVMPFLAVIHIHPEEETSYMGHRWPHALALLLAVGIAPCCLQEWDCCGQLLPGWMKRPSNANWTKLGVYVEADLPELCSTRSAGEWVLCLVFHFPCKRCRDVRPTRERLKRCGSLAAGIINNNQDQHKKAAGLPSLLALEAIWIEEIWFKLW